MNLFDSFGKQGNKYDLLTRQVDVVDTSYLSKYFVVSNFNPTLGPGKNSFSINGSNFLKPGSEILVECLDSSGKALYLEMAKTSNSPKFSVYKEGNAQVVSIQVFGDTNAGAGKLILYGTLVDNRSVRWVSNITIDKTKRNDTKVRFYQRPTLEVSSVLLPTFDTADNSENSQLLFSGQFNGFALNPQRDTLVNSVNRRTVDINYQLEAINSSISASTDNSASFNTQMVNSTIALSINKIAEPFSNRELSFNPPLTESFTVKEIVTNRSLKLLDPFSYLDERGNDLIANITSGSFSITYPFIGYNSLPSTYLTTSFAGNDVTIKASYADITYRNLRTFSGYVARHKVYRKSLYQKRGFELILDETISPNELLIDNNTKNISYDKLGVFYNSIHLARYWFTSSNNLFLSHTPDKYINSMKIDTNDISSVDGNGYVMVKCDSTGIQRNATYIPYNATEFNSTSGSSYDSNFISLKQDVQYLLAGNIYIEKNPTDVDARVSFYLTSSTATVPKEKGFSTQFGVKLAEVSASSLGPAKSLPNQLFFYTPQKDMYGTLVVVPYKCKVTLQDLSLRTFGDDGVSPDSYTTRIPWGISIANENFEIKSELFDVNSNLIYSNLDIFQSFDASGESLIPFIGSGSSEPGDLFVTGKLVVSKSIFVQTGDIVIQQNNLFIPNITACTGSGFNISGSRFTRWRATTGVICLSKLADVTHNDEYLFVSTGSDDQNAVLFDNFIKTRKSIASEYDSAHGRLVYFTAGDVKQTDDGSS